MSILLGKWKQTSSSTDDEVSLQSCLWNNAAAFFFKRILVFRNSFNQWIFPRTLFDVVLYFFRTFRHLLPLQLHFFAKLLNFHLQLFLLWQVFDVKSRHSSESRGSAQNLEQQLEVEPRTAAPKSCVACTPFLPAGRHGFSCVWDYAHTSPPQYSKISKPRISFLGPPNSQKASPNGLNRVQI